MTKKQLRAELEKAQNEIGRLQVTNANLLKQRSDLVDQLQKPLETLNNQPVLLYQELGNNIYNVLKTKGIDSCATTAIKLKTLAREQESKDRIVSPSSTTVSVVSAYKAWGIDIKDLIKRKKLKNKLFGEVQAWNPINFPLTADEQS